MASADSPTLTIFYIVEPPDYQALACYLLASIRKHFPPEVRAVGYCPAHRFDLIHPGVHIAHEKMGGEIRTFNAQGRFEPAYPHGNKMLAALEPRDTDWSIFIDSDVLFIRDNRVENLVRPGHVSCSMAASMLWAEQSVWQTIYSAVGMEMPPERYHLMRRSTEPLIPYFSAGLVAFPERATAAHGRLPDVWYDVAQMVDRVETLENRRPYLDQMTLPLAIRRAGLEWNILPEEQHYILGGRLKHQPLPEGRKIYTIHYRNLDNLRHVGHHHTARGGLKTLTGEKYPRRLAPDVPDPWLEAMGEAELAEMAALQGAVGAVDAAETEAADQRSSTTWD